MAKTDLALFTTQEVTEAAKSSPVVLLPLGTLESNGPQQLLGADTIITDRLATVVAERTGALKLPTPYYGCSDMHTGMDGTFPISDALFGDLVEAIVTGAANSGFTKVLVFNCHKPNFPPIERVARKLRRSGVATVATLDPLEVIRDLSKDLFGQDFATAGGHGGEPLMSVVAHFHPQDVRLTQTAKPEVAPYLGFASAGGGKYAFGGSKVTFYPDAPQINATGGWWNQADPTPERGGAAFERLCAYTADFVKAYAAAA